MRGRIKATALFLSSDIARKKILMSVWRLSSYLIDVNFSGWGRPGFMSVGTKPKLTVCVDWRDCSTMHCNGVLFGLILKLMCETGILSTVL